MTNTAKITIDLSTANWNFGVEHDRDLLADFLNGKLAEESMNDFIQLILRTEFLLYCHEHFITDDLLIDPFIRFPKGEFEGMRDELLKEELKNADSENYFTNSFLRGGVFTAIETREDLSEKNTKPCMIFIEDKLFTVFILDEDDADYFLNP